jgi:hypothetical protein
MAITMRSAISKEKPISQALAITTATPVECYQDPCSGRLARSPKTSNVNNHLAEINRPITHLNNVLEALQPSRNSTPNDPNNNLDAPCDLTLQTDKSGRMTTLNSPTGVDVQDRALQAPANNVSPQASNVTDTRSTPPSRSVRINMTAITASSPEGISQGMANSPKGVSRGRQLILMSSSTSVLATNEPEKYDASLPTKGHTSKIYDQDQKLYRVFSEDGMKKTAYHVTDFAGFYPIWPIVEFSMAPTGAMKDKQMTLFIKCVTALLGEMLYVDKTAMIAPIDITDYDATSFIKTKVDLPANFTKLGKHIMISGGSWVFDKKEKGNNDIYGRFRLKSQIPTEDIINPVSFEFSWVGGKNIFKKQHRAMETEMPLMLLFVCNGTDHSSILSDTRQMLDLAYDDIKQNGMLPEEYENKDIPEFSLRFNVPRLPADTKKSNNRAYDHYREQGKKAFHFEVAKEEVPYFKYLSGHAHQMQLDNKFFGKFAKFAATLGNNAPMSNCVSLRRCIQGHLNFHLSSTSITIHGIDTINTSEILQNAADKKTIAKFTLQDLLYCIKLESNAPLFLQLSQRSTGEVDAVISNTPEAKTMAEKMNLQIAAWCHFYWKDTNPGAEKFYCKLIDRAFNQVLRHEISSCTWDAETKVVTLPRAMTKMAAIAEFEQQDWVQHLTGGGSTLHGTAKQHVDPNVAFPFEDDFSVGTIYGANATAKPSSPTVNKVVEIQDNKDDVSVLTTKTRADNQSKVVVGSRAASSSNPVVGLTAKSTQTKTASRGSLDTASAGPAGGAAGGPGGK